MYIDEEGKMKVGVNSRLVREISGGPLSLSYLDVELIELGFDDVPMLSSSLEINHAMLWALDSFDVSFSLHVPTSDARELNLRVDLGRMSRHNFRVMECVFEIASLLDVRHVVIHGGDIIPEHWGRFAGISYRKAFLNTVRNLKTLAQLARDYSLMLCLENLDDNRVGSLPVELLALLHDADADNISVTFDTGHAFIIAERYGISLSEFFDILHPFIKHVHLHDNDGISDLHLPLGEGKIDVCSVLRDIWDIQPEDVVLEIKSFSDPENVKESIKAARCDFHSLVMLHP